MYSRSFLYLFQNSAPIENAIEQEDQQKILPRISHEKDSKLFQSISTWIQLFPIFASIVILGEFSGEPLILIKNPCNKTCNDKRNKEQTLYITCATLNQWQRDEGNHPTHVHAVQAQQFNKIKFRKNVISFFHHNSTQSFLMINR